MSGSSFLFFTRLMHLTLLSALCETHGILSRYASQPESKVPGCSGSEMSLTAMRSWKWAVRESHGSTGGQGAEGNGTVVHLQYTPYTGQEE